ncbi:hypothetical protein NL676_030652 [Syzygium grande]|nr:hypothetical protein NL676_030652 [Syzygium grande]
MQFSDEQRSFFRSSVAKKGKWREYERGVVSVDLSEPSQPSSETLAKRGFRRYLIGVSRKTHESACATVEPCLGPRDPRRGNWATKTADARCRSEGSGELSCVDSGSMAPGVPSPGGWATSAPGCLGSRGWH